MRTLSHHVDRLRAKPHATRRQIALASAFGISAFIALLWFVGVVATGTFNIQGTSFAESTGQEPSLAANAPPKNSNIIGAASAALGFEQGDSARIEIVSSATSSTLSQKDRQSEQTVIPF